MLKLLSDVTFDKREFYDGFLLKKKSGNGWSDVLAANGISEIKMYCKQTWGIDPSEISVMESDETSEYWIGKMEPADARGITSNCPMFLNVYFTDELPEINLVEYNHRNQITNLTAQFQTKDKTLRNSILKDLADADSQSNRNILVFDSSRNMIYCCSIYRHVHTDDSLNVVFDVFNTWRNIVTHRALI